MSKVSDRIQDLKARKDTRLQNNINIGELLKQERIKKGISLDYVAQYTRIRINFLENLEQNNYNDLPERTYALGYLRTYANFLEILNVEELVEMLDSIYDFSNPIYSDANMISLDEKYSFFSNMKRRSTRDKIEERKIIDNTKNYNKSIIIIFVLILFISIGIVIYFLKSNNRYMVQTDNQTYNQLNQLVEDSEFIIAENNSQEQENNVAESSNTSRNIFNNSTSKGQETIYKPFSENIAKSNIILEFQEEVWVLIYNKNNINEIYLDKIFQAGEAYQIPAIENLMMKVGNYRGIKVKIGLNELSLSSNRRSNVLDGILLEEKYLSETYDRNR